MTNTMILVTDDAFVVLEAADALLLSLERTSLTKIRQSSTYQNTAYGMVRENAFFKAH